jgi:hypothetical protein
MHYGYVSVPPHAQPRSSALDRCVKVEVFHLMFFVAMQLHLRSLLGSTTRPEEGEGGGLTSGVPLCQASWQEEGDVATK